MGILDVIFWLLVVIIIAFTILGVVYFITNKDKEDK